MSTLLVTILVLLVVGAIVFWFLPESTVKPLALKVFTVIIVVLTLAWVLEFFHLLPAGHGHL